MQASEKGSIRSFVILSYLIFWVLFSITGATVFGGAPDFVQTLMKNVCAWSSTFALLIIFARRKPQTPFFAFLKAQFPAVGILDFLVPALIQVLIAICAAGLFLSWSGASIQDLRFLEPSAILPLLLVSLSSGPLGEELGWRSFALKQLQERHAPLGSALRIGLLWGFWHFPLWLVSGYAGLDLVYYSLTFMLGILGFSVFLTYFYNKSGHILVAVWMHLLFNVLMQVVLFEGYGFMIVVSALYLLVSVALTLIGGRTMLGPSRRVRT